MSVSNEVRQASDRFYSALGRLINGDASPILETLSQGPEISMLHPLGGRVVGAEAVRRNLQEIAMAISNGQVAAEDLVIVPVTSDVAYTLCTERAQGTIGGETVNFETRATNLYRNEDGEWKLMHHHVDLAPEAAAALQRFLARIPAH
ncbi:MAG TPA: nuclear transport factor 2 family protein [Chloroflexota bacterium]|nr:nuclear transport factor 2 family protein [Chloroflexota bacterium]